MSSIPCNLNIIDAHKLFKGQLVIVISGMSGCKKTKIAKKLAGELKLKYISQFDFYKKDYSSTIEVKYSDNNTVSKAEVINWDTDNAIDFDLLNKAVNDNKKDGLIISGFSFPADKIKFAIDGHIHIKMSKELCLQRRHDFLNEHKDVYVKEYDNMGTPLEKAILNKLTYPYYYETLKKEKIDKLFEDKNDDNDIYDSIWDFVMFHIQAYINWFNKNEYPKWKSVNGASDSTEEEEEDDDDADDNKIKDGPVMMPEDMYPEDEN